jgi:hypothetical protein
MRPKNQARNGVSSLKLYDPDSIYNDGTFIPPAIFVSGSAGIRGLLLPNSAPIQSRNDVSAFV